MRAISTLIDGLARPDEPGIAVAVIRNGEATQHCVGLANLAHGAPIRPQTRFHIVSVSKTFMATAMLILAARGKLSLDDDIRRHLPELKHPGEVTIRHLLSLTSGLRDVLEIERLRGVWHTAPSRQHDLLSLAAQQTEVSRSAGAAYLYTNVNHVLLEEIINRVTGSAEAFHREAIYEPLRLEATAARPHDGTMLTDLAEPYVQRDGGVWLRPHDLLGIAGDVLTSSLDDLTRWVLALRRGAIGDVPITTAMAEPGRLADGTALHYGLGLAVRRYRGLQVLCHTGTQPGYKAHIAFVPERDLGIVVLSNRESTRPAPLAAQLMEALIGDFPSFLPRSVGQVDPALAGMYVDPSNGEWLSITIDDGVLQAEGCGDTLFLYRGADGVFRDADDYRAGIPARLTFDGTACDMSLGGIRAHLMRQPPPGFEPGDYVGRYENRDIDSVHTVTREGDTLFIQYGLGYEETRRFAMQLIAPDIFLVRPTAPGVAHRHVFRFERENGRVAAAAVTMERLKGVRLSRSSP
jgi:CubicO group peptidase (beta-lactamase class C family)